MSESSIRYRVMLEPRGFIRAIELILAIVVFATTGGYKDECTGLVKCHNDSASINFSYEISYPFNLEATTVHFPKCNAAGNHQGFIDTTLDGDFSPTAQWFEFVSVMAFLICITTIVFYVGFELSIRATYEYAVTVTDLVLTGIWAFLWLTAASSWAWGLNQVKTYAALHELFILNKEVGEMCSQNTCRQLTVANYSPLNASVAFAFLSFLVWVGNVWFVYKETPYHDDQVNLTPKEGMPPQEVPSNQN